MSNTRGSEHSGNPKKIQFHLCKTVASYFVSSELITICGVWGGAYVWPFAFYHLCISGALVMVGLLLLLLLQLL